MLRIVFSVAIAFALAFTTGGGSIASVFASRLEQVNQADEKCIVEIGQELIENGEYDKAVREFTCVINDNPTDIEGYRGRIEALLLLNRFADAFKDYANVTAYVLPVHPDAASTVVSGYDERLSESPDDIPALKGASFAQWWLFAYPAAIKLIDHLLEIQPDDLYGNLFRGSSRVLQGIYPTGGSADLEYAITLAPKSPDVRWVVADAYLYGRSDYQRAFSEASLALKWGLDTPRVHAILAGATNAFGDLRAAAEHTKRHIDLVTTEFVQSSVLYAGASLTLELIPGRTFVIPIPAQAGETLNILTSSHDFLDTITVLFDPDGNPVVGADDYIRYFAGFKWTAEETGTYLLWATSFESIDTGELLVTHK